MRDIEKKEIQKFKEENKKKKSKSKVNFKWIIEILLLAFIISLVFSFGSEMILPNVNVFIAIIVVIIFILIGVVFDMIGVACASADEKPFHSMNSRKVRGAKIAVSFVKNAEKVSSFCNDVIGDICGIISGTAGVIVASKIANSFNLDLFITTLLVTATIAALTIGGKAIGKSFAINKSNIILYEFSKIASIFYKK